MMESLLTKINAFIGKVSSYEIYSSTEMVLEAISLIPVIFKESSDLKEAVQATRYYVKKIVKSRPTSVMLVNAFRRILSRLSKELDYTKKCARISEVLKEEVESIKHDVESGLETVAYIASRRIRDGDTILVNSYSTTLLKLIKKASERMDIKVYVVESRPGSEGMLMASEVSKMGVPVTLFVDSAVRYFIRDVDRVFVSSEAISANGAVVNKIGTSLIALAAHEARVRVFVTSILMKFSPETILGELVQIPRISVNRISKPDIGEEVEAELPLFDVTPPEYIDAIITEKGLIAPEAVLLLIAELYGWPPKFPEIDEELKEVMLKAGVGHE